MIDKKRLLAISELILAGKIEDMNDEQMREYEQLLVAFIENFPGEEEKIKAALSENVNEGIDYNELANSLTAMCKTLGKIHADDIARECLKQIGQLKGAGREQVEAYVTSFLSSVAMLSIDIQMAKYLKTVRYAEEKKNGTAETEDKPVDKTTDTPQSAKAEKTILAVDDAAFPLTMLKKSLQGLPYYLICLNSGKEALLYLKQNQPDMFILDIEMPKMDGYELAEKIREAGQAAPIIFLTGNATRRNVMKAVEAGASDFVVKPIDKKKLVDKISKYL
jgi:CheY-like chemotaxis protein